MAAQEPFIVCDNLVKIYKVAGLEVVALQGLDLVVPAGELLGIVGPSGSGKTTLMNILGGLYRPSAGRVWVDGQDLLKLSAAALDRYRRSRVGFVWQQSSRNLVYYLTALENVELPMTLAGRNGNKRRRAEELLEAVGLAECRHSRLAQLSGGEQQRVAIAVALANDPALLLADEPTGEVDSAMAQVIYDTFRRLNRERSLTTVIVSHDPGIARHVDRVVAIRDGKTALETVRQPARTLGAQGGTSSVGREISHEREEVFEELVVLDSAGRLQVPKDYLERFAIKGRARLELVENGILILPAPQTAQPPTAEAYAASLAGEPEAHRWRRRRVLARLRRAAVRAYTAASAGMGRVLSILRALRGRKPEYRA